MFAEFAVEPAAMVTSVDRFNGMIDRFGIDQGRIISDFAAGGWSAEVMGAAEQLLPSLAQERVEIRLAEKLREKAILRLRRYPGVAGGWPENVLAEHRRAPWAGVVTEDGCCGLACEVLASDINGGQPPFNVSRSGDFPRTPEGIVAAASQLIKVSKALHLVDPHITLDSRAARIRQWVEPIAGLINASPSLHSVTIHTVDRDDKPPWDLFESNFRQRFRNRLPVRPSITIQRWRQRGGCEEFHDRFVLTDVGGLKYGQGLDAGPDGTMVGVHLLDRIAWESQLRKVDPSSSPFIPEDPIIYQLGQGG